jgi:hypothetical protein
MGLLEACNTGVIISEAGDLLIFGNKVFALLPENGGPKHSHPSA